MATDELSSMCVRRHCCKSEAASGHHVVRMPSYQITDNRYLEIGWQWSGLVDANRSMSC